MATFRTLGNPVNERTPALDLALPHLLNDQRDDVERLRSALAALDAAHTAVLQAMALKARQQDLDAHAASTADALALKASTAALNALSTSTNDALALKASLAALDQAVATLNASIALRAPLATPTIVGLREARIALGAGTAINLAQGNYVTKTIAGATTLSVSGTPAAGTVAAFLLELTNGGSAAVTWWANCRWSGGVAPVLTAAGRDLLGFVTHDGGANWLGMRLAKDVR